MKSVFKKMKLPKFRGLNDINTFMRKQGKPQSLNELLNELSKLVREKDRLYVERENWQSRVEKIDARLEEVEKQIKLLQQTLAQRTQAFVEEDPSEEVMEKNVSNKGKAESSDEEEDDEPDELIIKY